MLNSAKKLANTLGRLYKLAGKAGSFIFGVVCKFVVGSSLLRETDFRRHVYYPMQVRKLAVASTNRHYDTNYAVVNPIGIKILPSEKEFFNKYPLYIQMSLFDPKSWRIIPPRRKNNGSLLSNPSACENKAEVI